MNEDSKVIFDRMIGCWSFVEKVQAQQNSVNCPAGTWETKCKSVTKQEYIKMIVEKVIPVAIAKWPRNRSTQEQTISIQQDNPNTHGLHDDPAWLGAKDRDERFKFKIKHQPPNPPDTNVLDLGFFARYNCCNGNSPQHAILMDLLPKCKGHWDNIIHVSSTGSF